MIVMLWMQCCKSASVVADTLAFEKCLSLAPFYSLYNWKQIFFFSQGYERHFSSVFCLYYSSGFFKKSCHAQVASRDCQAAPQCMGRYEGFASQSRWNYWQLFSQKSRSPGKFDVIRQVQGQARKLIGMSGSGPVIVTRVRHSPVITGQFHNDEAESRSS